MGLENIEYFNKKVESQSSEILLVDCDISTRAYQALKSIGIVTLDGLSKFQEAELINKLPNFNPKLISEVKELLVSHQLDFKAKDE